MTELSYFWGEEDVGDSLEAPYYDDLFADLFSEIFLYDPAKYGVVPNYLNGLVVSNPSGTTINIASGAAIVAGRIYTNDATVVSSVTAPGAGTNYYCFVLRKDEAAQTVRVVRLGPNASAYPALTQTAATWEITLANVSITSGGVITITFNRWILRSNGFRVIMAVRRKGGSSIDYTVGGTNVYTLADGLVMAFGQNLYSQYFSISNKAQIIGGLVTFKDSVSPTWAHQPDYYVTDRGELTNTFRIASDPGKYNNYFVLFYYPFR